MKSHFDGGFRFFLTAMTTTAGLVVILSEGISKSVSQRAPQPGNVFNVLTVPATKVEATHHQDPRIFVVRSR